MKILRISASMVIFFLSLSSLQADVHTSIIGSWQVIGENCDDSGNKCQPENSPILTFTRDGFLIKNKNEKKAPVIIKDNDVIVMNGVTAHIISINNTIMIMETFEMDPGGSIIKLKKVTGNIEDIMKKWHK